MKGHLKFKGGCIEGFEAQFFKGSFLNKRLKGEIDQEKFGAALKEKLQQESGLPKAKHLTQLVTAWKIFISHATTSLYYDNISKKLIELLLDN